MAPRWTVSEDGKVATRIDGIVVRVLKEQLDPTAKGDILPDGIGIALAHHPEANYRTSHADFLLQPEKVKYILPAVEEQGIWFSIADGSFDEWRERVDALIPLRDSPRILVEHFFGLDTFALARRRNDGWRILHVASDLNRSGRFGVLMEKDIPVVTTDEPPFTVSR